MSFYLPHFLILSLGLFTFLLNFINFINFSFTFFIDIIPLPILYLPKHTSIIFSSLKRGNLYFPIKDSQE